MGFAESKLHMHDTMVDQQAGLEHEGPSASEPDQGTPDRTRFTAKGTIPPVITEDGPARLSASELAYGDGDRDIADFEQIAGVIRNAPEISHDERMELLTKISQLGFSKDPATHVDEIDAMLARCGLPRMPAHWGAEHKIKFANWIDQQPDKAKLAASWVGVAATDERDFVIVEENVLAAQTRTEDERNALCVRQGQILAAISPAFFGAEPIPADLIAEYQAIGAKLDPYPSHWTADKRERYRKWYEQRHPPTAEQIAARQRGYGAQQQQARAAAQQAMAQHNATQTFFQQQSQTQTNAILQRQADQQNQLQPGTRAPVQVAQQTVQTGDYRALYAGMAPPQAATSTSPTSEPTSAPPAALYDAVAGEPAQQSDAEPSAPVDPAFDASDVVAGDDMAAHQPVTSSDAINFDFAKDDEPSKKAIVDSPVIDPTTGEPLPVIAQTDYGPDKGSMPPTFGTPTPTSTATPVRGPVPVSATPTRADVAQQAAQSAARPAEPDYQAWLQAFQAWYGGNWQSHLVQSNQAAFAQHAAAWGIATEEDLYGTAPIPHAARNENVDWRRVIEAAQLFFTFATFGTGMPLLADVLFGAAWSTAKGLAGTATVDVSTIVMEAMFTTLVGRAMQSLPVTKRLEDMGYDELNDWLESLAQLTRETLFDAAQHQPPPPRRP